MTLAFLIGCTACSASAPRTAEDGDADGDANGDDVGTVETDTPVIDASDGADGNEDGIAGGDDGGQEGGVASDHDLCTGICTVTAAVATCPVSLSNCTVRCDRQFAQGICLPALRALVQCQTAAGPEAFDCVAGGVMTKPGVCAAEYKGSADCRSGDAGT